MNPQRIADATRNMGAPKDWDPERHGECGVLPIRDVELPGGHNGMVSEWKPDAEELAALNAGGSVFLRIVGQGHPPVWVWAEAAQG